MSTHFVGEGNIGSAPDYREFPNGNDEPRRLLRLNVYFDNPIPKKDGEYEDRGGFWAPVELWHRDAEHWKTLYQKGMRVLVEGRTVRDEWEDADENERVTFKVEARRVGILPVGYGDGLPRSLGNVGHVLVGGAPCAILGRVSMDLTAVDLEPAWPVAPGQRVLLWGEEGTRKITPWDWARWSGTIPYEILTGISCRVARRYVENGRSWTEVGILR
jgi:single-strand DNA-binding protein